MIPVTKPFLPPQNEYNELIKRLWETNWLTNNGEYAQELEKVLKDFLKVKSVFFVGNGTLALQLSLKSLQIKGEVITTPFSFVATTNAIIWEDCQPVFVDIDPETLCINADKIEEAITEKTSAILATHVYGIPCNVEMIELIAKKHNLKVIYDAAHAFGVRYKGKSLLNYGDISILSFHATKLFHTVEGGGIINNCGLEVDEKIKQLRNFGIEGDNILCPGINAKNSEFHAAMGLCNLKYVDDIIIKRSELTESYDFQLGTLIKRPKMPIDVNYNFAYYPIIFKNEIELLSVKNILENNNISARRYFYPSLNKLPYLKNNSCPISESIASKILCLPLYDSLEVKEIVNIASIIKGVLG